MSYNSYVGTWYRKNSNNLFSIHNINYGAYYTNVIMKYYNILIFDLCTSSLDFDGFVN